MRFRFNIDTEQWFLIPSIGILRMRRYVIGYKYRIAFAWLHFRFSVGVGKK